MISTTPVPPNFVIHFPINACSQELMLVAHKQSHVLNKNITFSVHALPVALYILLKGPAFILLPVGNTACIWLSVLSQRTFTNISGGGSSFRLHMTPKLDAVNIHVLAAFEFLFLACQQVELLRLGIVEGVLSMLFNKVNKF